MQTHEWETLLDGTTEGPWEYREHEHCPYADMEDRATIHGGPMPEIPYPCGCEADDTCEVQRYVVGAKDGVWADNPAFWEVNPADMKAAAHLPEAVAEVVRLRREIIAMRDRLRNTARVFTHKDLGRCNPHDDMADDLDRILEGEEQ